MAQGDSPAQRPDTEDYDLLTYGEAAARLAELLAAERDRLAALRNEPHPDPRRVEQIEQRIALLESSNERYRQQARSSDTFTRRFGSIQRGGRGPTTPP